MATDDERREVARRLREYVDLPDDWWADTYSGFYVEKCAFGNVERHRESELFARLADLIDPTCLARADVEDTPDGGQFECWSCSVCGNIISVDPDYDTETDGPAYCEACGHRIVGKGEPTWL